MEKQEKKIYSLDFGMSVRMDFLPVYYSNEELAMSNFQLVLNFFKNSLVRAKKAGREMDAA